MYVFDTNVLVAAFLSRSGASYRLLRGIVLGEVPLMATPALVFEYEDVLKRNFMRNAWATPQGIDDVLDVLCDRMIHVERHFRWRPMLRDPGDDLVFECALNGGATTIVTTNTADFLPEARRFGIEVLKPGAFLQALGHERR